MNLLIFEPGRLSRPVVGCPLATNGASPPVLPAGMEIYSYPWGKEGLAELVQSEGRAVHDQRVHCAAPVRDGIGSHPDSQARRHEEVDLLRRQVA